MTTASPTCDNAAKVAFDLELKWDAKLTSCMSSASDSRFSPLSPMREPAKTSRWIRLYRLGQRRDETPMASAQGQREPELRQLSAFPTGNLEVARQKMST
jgi:hypothetical protein